MGEQILIYFASVFVTNSDEHEICTRAVYPLAEEKNIQIEYHIPSHLALYADEDRIIQVARNLFENALKYTPEGGGVHIHASKTEQVIRFAISNTSTAIPQSELGHIFDRFYRADSSRNRERGGFGLGLAITKQSLSFREEQFR